MSKINHDNYETKKEARDKNYKAATDKLKPLHEFRSALTGARIKAGLSQKQLAEKLGLKEQQIQRYEATDYESASLRRVSEPCGSEVAKNVSTNWLIW